jgi:hypothetical protein
MTNFRIKIAPGSKTNEFVTEAFNALTIVMVGVLGILTVAATI